MVEIVEAYDGYEPPSGVHAAVEALLASAPPELLVGLDTVRLTNSAALGSRRRRWTWSRRRKIGLGHAAGLYHQRSGEQPPCIEVFVDQALHGTPGWALRWATVREVLLGGVLYHELGHHIHTTSRPEYRERETVAEVWARRLLREHVRRQHPRLWAARPVIALAGRILRPAGLRSHGPSS